MRDYANTCDETDKNHRLANRTNYKVKLATYLHPIEIGDSLFARSRTCLHLYQIAKYDKIETMKQNR